MKTYNRREVERIILKNGWELDHCTGGHSIYKKEGVKKTLSIAYKKCNRMVVQRLIKEFGLVTQEDTMGKYSVTVREIFEHTYQLKQILVEKQRVFVTQNQMVAMLMIMQILNMILN